VPFGISLAAAAQSAWAQEAHNAIEQWMVANRRESAGHSWEIYGDPTPDPGDTETTVMYP
jgi:hypothetical protein